jgi:ABC-type sugar transport system permease subunit
MESLKNNIDNLSDETQELINDYLKLFSIRQSEKLTLFLGVLSTAFILTLLLMVVVILISFALAGFLNHLLGSQYWGTAIVIGLFLLFVGFLIWRIIKTKTPLLSNLFTKIILSVFDLDINQGKNVQGLRSEIDTLKTKIETDKTNIKTNVQLLRYAMMEGLFRELFGLLKPKKKKQGRKDTDQPKDKKESKK